MLHQHTITTGRVYDCRCAAAIAVLNHDSNIIIIAIRIAIITIVIMIILRITIVAIITKDSRLTQSPSSRLAVLAATQCSEISPNARVEVGLPWLFRV